MKFKYLFVLSFILGLSSCESFEELAADPNRATQVNPGLLLTGIEVSAFNRVSDGAALAARYLVFTDGIADEQYYGWQRAGFGGYSNLRQVTKMIEEAERTNLLNYVALGKFFRAYFFHDLTRTFGDIPYSEALKGESENFAPKYDRQEDVYLGILQELEEANAMLNSANGVINGDVIYGGNILKWKKLINSFRLRVLIDLSAKTGNQKLNVIDQVRAIVNDPATYPIFESNADNAQLEFFDRDGNRYPNYNNRSLQTAYYLTESFANLLKERNDPRLFLFAEPERRARENGQPGFEGIVGAYGGLNAGAQLTENVLAASNEGKGSPVDPRYHSEPIGEPVIAVGFPELMFNLAEAAARGWIDADAAEFYRSGIRASMEFYGVASSRINEYLQHDKVAFNESKAVEMIVTQKYLSSFFNTGWEPFYNQRRTGFPEFVVGPGTQNNGQIPKRWMYPQSELDYNQSNVAEAINRQFGGNDNVNQVMWLLVEE
jgi:hypothetical protein